MPLSPEEIESIKVEATDWVCLNHPHKDVKYMDFIKGIYIAAVTAEREKAKGLLEALQRIKANVHINNDSPIWDICNHAIIDYNKSIDNGK